jgi:hypothetical protein
MVSVVWVALQDLLAANSVAFYEFVQLCRNREHKLFGNTAEVLGTRGWINDGQPHDATRSIVLASVEGDDLAMHLVSPLPEMDSRERHSTSEQGLDIDTFVRAMLDSRRGSSPASEATERAFTAACYLQERGVVITAGDLPFQLAGLSIHSFHTWCERRGLLNEESQG